LLQFFGVPGSFHRDPGGGVVDLAEIVGSEFECDRSVVLVQAIQLRGARNGNYPRFLGQQPGKGYLGRGGYTF